MAAKARLSGDAGTVGEIMAAPHPGAAKALGRRVRGFDEQRWAEHRFDVVVAGNMAKLGQHRQLRDCRAGTGSRVLVEASPRDRSGASAWPSTTSGPVRRKAGKG